MTKNLPTETTISALLLEVLNTADAVAKANHARTVFREISAQNLPFGAEPAPDRPARPAKPELVPPNKMPRRGTGGLKGRQGLLHALAHIELNAIDLAADIIIRFGADLPAAFTTDWLSVLDDEARHFLMLEKRLNELECSYGALAAHDGLWQAAYDTRHDLGARLAIVPLVHEARGLDVTPPTVERLETHGDAASAALLTIIYNDEITHVKIGMRWLNHYCAAQQIDIARFFQKQVAQHMRGGLKPPFNDEARALADFPATLYAPD